MRWSLYRDEPLADERVGTRRQPGIDLVQGPAEGSQLVGIQWFEHDAAHRADVPRRQFHDLIPAGIGEFWLPDRARRAGRVRGAPDPVPPSRAIACEVRDCEEFSTSASWFIRSARPGASDSIARIR